MTNYLKTPQSALNGFTGYGGTRFPHVDQRAFVLSIKNSRALTWRLTSMVIARHADGFKVLGLGLKWCACLITCTLVVPRDKTCLPAIPLYPLPVLALRGFLC
jgi:hypothetical protein